MPKAADKIEFCYGGMPVGYFDLASFPKSEGSYRYMPYRSMDHLKMCRAAKTGDRPRCSFTAHGRAYSFVVVDVVANGELIVAEMNEVG